VRCPADRAFKRKSLIPLPKRTRTNANLGSSSLLEDNLR
jgi:hypothetical protein